MQKYRNFLYFFFNWRVLISDKEYMFTYFPPINSIVFMYKYSYCMGSNASKSTSAYIVYVIILLFCVLARHLKLEISMFLNVNS